ncbi:hypothetical protein [Alysiella filiformis]|uniref:Uncharacterized protein n=1 Tax=Alysiella filiformis DSM 16848 TaxID=1120981 RepID=A0A286E9G2_9NEIS|nr:hypothetical protein [Alysiella filiformis]QMT31411.1 hypothetical protein H3L97_00385 [Alysiella filiformis]UBQ55579.1 hypothetical protein JF568_08285 [Alysiella filiformis DSM 16848]SOD67548.1 hypothetical protein SAMN02746062_00947 [Alysiella filiformis DSM 16848]
MKKYLSLLLLGLTPFTFAKETLEFLCNTDHNGKVSIHSTPQKSHYIYRFYKNGKLKLTIKHNYQQIFQNSLNENHISIMRFQNNNYQYSIYNADFRYAGADNPVAGIEITTLNDKEFVSRLACIKIHKNFSNIQ